MLQEETEYEELFQKLEEVEKQADQRLSGLFVGGPDMQSLANLDKAKELRCDAMRQLPGSTAVENVRECHWSCHFVCGLAGRHGAD